MKKDITVFYESTRRADNENEHFSFSADGVLNIKNNETYITYNDSIGKTVLKIKNGEISVIRFGENANTLRFGCGRSDVILYKTPYGVFETEVTAHVAEYTENNGTGVVRLAYTLNFSGETSEHTFKLTYNQKFCPDTGNIDTDTDNR